jgi:hypothetical protein
MPPKAAASPKLVLNEKDYSVGFALYILWELLAIPESKLSVVKKEDQVGLESFDKLGRNA